MYAILKEGKTETHDRIPTLKDMQEVVGGYIETALRHPSPVRKNVSVDAFVNEEGLLLGLPIHYCRLTDGSALAGNIVIVGTNVDTGKTVKLVQKEIDSILPWLAPVSPWPGDIT
jgi:hypothetical protein